MPRFGSWWSVGFANAKSTPRAASSLGRQRKDWPLLSHVDAGGAANLPISPQTTRNPRCLLSLFFPPLAEAGPGCPGCPGCGLRRSAEPVSSATSSGRSLDGPGRPAIASNPFPFLVQDLTQHGQCPRQRDSRAAGLRCVLQRPDLLLARLLNSFLDATAAP